MGASARSASSAAPASTSCVSTNGLPWCARGTNGGGGALIPSPLNQRAPGGAPAPRVLTGRDAGLRPRVPAVGVDLDRVHRREIENDAAVARAEPGAAVAAAADCELCARRASERDDARDVRGVDRAYDRDRATIETGEEDAAGVAPCPAAPR